MKRILLGTFLCVAITGCELPEQGLSYTEVAQRHFVCEQAGGRQVFTMGGKNSKLAVSSRCLIKDIEYRFYYQKYKNGPQL